MLEKIHWLGHDSFRIDGVKTVYFDPWHISDGPKADIILITHSHYDHFSPADIALIQKDSTEIVCVSECRDKLSGKLHIIKPGDTMEIQGILIEAVPAYNTDKQFHPAANKWAGYIITLEDTRIYHAGDTDLIPEMKDIECDIALLPVSGTYVMTAREAVEAVKAVNPKIAISMHWGSIVGSEADAEYFKHHASCRVEILPWEK